jgi:hypothetical protein
MQVPAGHWYRQLVLAENPGKLAMDRAPAGDAGHATQSTNACVQLGIGGL